jgi:hypothetical protein
LYFFCAHLGVGIFGLSPRMRRLPPSTNNVVDYSVVPCLFRREYSATSHVVAYFGNGLLGVACEQLFEQPPLPDDLARLRLHVTNGSVELILRRGKDHTGVRQGEALSLGSCCQNERRCSGGLPTHTVETSVANDLIVSRTVRSAVGDPPEVFMHRWMGSPLPTA